MNKFVKLYKIDYSGSIPIYLQLATQTRMHIKYGILKPGEKMPPEKDICQILNISRTTVQKAMNLLVDQGLLLRYRGKGTFVSLQKYSRTFSHLYNFSNDMIVIGVNPSSQVLKQEVIDVKGTYIQEQLELFGTHTRAFHLKRVRCANDEPVLIEDTYLPYFLCQKIEVYDFAKLSLYETLKDRYNLEPSNAIERLQAIIIPLREQKILSCKNTTVGYRIQRTARLNSNIIYEFTVSITRADICSYQFKLYSVPSVQSNSAMIIQQEQNNL